MHLATYLELLGEGSRSLADSLRVVAEGHAAEADVHHVAGQLASRFDGHARMLQPAMEKYGRHPAGAPERLHLEAVSETRTGGLGLLRDLLDLHLLGTYLSETWVLVRQAAQGARDPDLLRTADTCAADVSAVLSWLETRMKAAAPQTLLIAD